MAILPILIHPDPRLRKKTLPVTVFDDKLQKLIDDLFETMYDAPGVGLAANQCGVQLRLSVMDCSEGKTEPMVLINPEILLTDERQEMEEGCLSVPDIRDTIQRFNRLRVRALDRHGKPFEMDCEGLAAQCVQHEIDHLDGKLYVDYLSSLKRERIKKKLTKLKEAHAG
ncbi:MULTISPECIES: peptide deformylase [Nevskia]|uniref:peptide deformylase n=1 Tax=Nevskia TaxID=64001 RepID=UPI0003B3ECE8|nr:MULTISPECIES: peptide deformylase [Nevskia]